MRCVTCNKSLVNDENIYDDRIDFRTFSIFECPEKHYRCHVSKHRHNMITDFSDAISYCVRRHFERGISDVVAMTPEGEGPGLQDTGYVKRYDRILSDEETRDTVNRFNKLTVLE